MPILYIPKPPTLEGDVINLYYLSKTGGHLSMCQRWIPIENEANETCTSIMWTLFVCCEGCKFQTRKLLWTLDMKEKLGPL